MATVVAPEHFASDHQTEIQTEARARIPRVTPALTAEANTPSAYRLSIEQYEAMVEAGILDGTDRVELVDGLLVSKMTKYPPHVLAAQLCLAAIAQVIPSGWHTRKEDPIRIPGRTSEPEPDIVVVKGTIRDYASRHPEPAEIALVVEVAESSLAFDREAKLKIYGGGGIPVYWIVNIVDRQLEIHTEPSGPNSEPAGYRRTAILKVGESAMLMLEGTELGPIPVANLLP